MKVQEIKIELRVVVTLPERNAHYTAEDIADLVREDIEGIQNGTMHVQMVTTGSGGSTTGTGGSTTGGGGNGGGNGGGGDNGMDG